MKMTILTCLAIGAVALIEADAMAQNTFPPSGNVGIGTTAPTNILVLNHASGDSVIDFQQAGASKVAIGADSGANTYIIGASAGDSGIRLTSGQKFYIANGNAIPFVTFQNNGNVGIGTTSPLGMLDVGTVGGLIVSGANLDPNGSYNLTPLQNSGKLMLAWNRSGGQGEIDLVSNRSGGSTGGFAFYDYTNNGTLNSLASFQGNGNVGIGTMWPGARLEVVGNVKLSGGGASLTFADATTQNTAWTGTLCGGDYAESVDVSDKGALYEPGDLIVIDPSASGKFLKSTQSYSTLVAGIYSTKPGVVGRRQQGDPNVNVGEIPMAMIGIVPTKVSAENGPINSGDLLVTSSTPGRAMKGTDRNLLTGAVVGKALGNLTSGIGVLDVLVTLQ